MEGVWQQILGKMATGIYILTVSHKEEINGMIISWVSCISYQPPLVMVAIHPNRYSHHLVEESGCFALHVLAQGQTDLLENFRQSDPETKFKSISWYEGKTGCPVLSNCVAYMECEVKESITPGNHTLFFGEIKQAQVFSNQTPMSTLDYSGIYLGKN